MTFLSYIAEQPQFVRHNGKSAIENVKQEKLFDILEFASEKKDMAELINNFYESKK